MIHSWADLFQYHKQLPTFNFSRDVNVQKKYNDFKKLHGNNIGNYLISHIFHSNFMKKHKPWFKLIPCDFPYTVADGISHWILWIHPSFPNIKYNHDDFDKIIQYYLQYYRPLNKYKKYIFFENAVVNRSVLAIRHLHIFFR